MTQIELFVIKKEISFIFNIFWFLFYSVVRNTRNPVYDEDFTFYGLSINELQQMSLHFVVLSFDRYSRDDVIGEVGELELKKCYFQNLWIMLCHLQFVHLHRLKYSKLKISKWHWVEKFNLEAWRYDSIDTLYHCLV